MQFCINQSGLGWAVYKSDVNRVFILTHFDMSSNHNGHIQINYTVILSYVKCEGTSLF